MGVRIKLHTCNVYIICSYIPLASDIAIYLEHLSLIKIVTSRLKLNDKLIVLGDFKLPNDSWILNDDLGCYIPFSYLLIYKEFFDGLHGLGHCQLNNIFNVDNKLLHLFFCWDLYLELFHLKISIIPLYCWLQIV
uniref:Uncharacterized protein n=1 Tax=Glossina morsitans morsitans TaxID=37546 RepID=A0A1B0FRF5_GLOMM